MRNAATEKLLSMASSTGLAITEEAFAGHLDEEDPLRSYRANFHFPKTRSGGHCVYLASSTFGLPHVEAEAEMQSLARKWREQGVEAYRLPPNPWEELAPVYCRELASLVGASANEIGVGNSHTANLSFLLAAFYHHRGAARKRILVCAPPSPGELAGALAHLALQGFNAAEDLLRFSAVEREEGARGVASTAAILRELAAHADDAAILLLPAVDPRSGCFFDLDEILRAARQRGVVVGVDCSDAVGNLPLRLHAWGVDFAFWGAHRLLGGGPGGVAGVFLHATHAMPGSEMAALRGWGARGGGSGGARGPDEETEAEGDGDGGGEGGGGGATHLPADCFTAPTLGLAVLRPALRTLAAAGIDAIRQKSLLLTAYLELLISEMQLTGCVDVITPADPARRGAQLSIRVLPGKVKLAAESAVGVDACDASVLHAQLLDAGVMVDPLPPDVIRLTLAPLYNSFADVLYAVCAISSMF